jgi:DNA-binding MurR/RpiR family transcriptional regulator
VTIGAERSLLQCVDDALLHDQHNLTATREGLNMAAFEAMARRLAQDTGRIHVLAQINSAPVGSWLALHLNMCRPGVQELGAGAMDTTDQLLWVQPEDVLLAFSIRRYASGPVKVAQRFREAGAQVMVITDSPAAPLAALAHEHILVRTSNASPFDSYTAAFFLCNALVSAVAQLRHAVVSEALKRRDALWKDVEDQQLIVSETPARKHSRR